MNQGRRWNSATGQPHRWRWLLWMLLAMPSVLFAPPPAWWAARGATNTAPRDDFAAANIGQLKHIASKAVDELQAHLPGGAGTVLLDMVAKWHTPPEQLNPPGPPRDDFAAVNIGQLKAVAKPFYDRLIAVGYTTAYPWTATTTDDDDFAIANLGQLKQVFRFHVAKDTDGDGIPDWWETKYGLNPNNPSDANATAAGGGMTNGQHYGQGSNPNQAPPPATITAAVPTLDQNADTLLYPADDSQLLIKNGNFSAPVLQTVPLKQWRTLDVNWDLFPGLPPADPQPHWTPVYGGLVELQKITTVGSSQYCELDADWDQPALEFRSHGIQQTVDLARRKYILIFDYRGRAVDAGSFVVKVKSQGSTSAVTLVTKNGASTTEWKRAIATFDITGGNPNVTNLPVTLMFDSTDESDGRGAYIDNVILLPVDIAVDADRNGLVEFGKDTTSPQKPFRFWINDDYDLDYNEYDEPLTGVANNSDTTINGIRDLEDLTQVKFKIPQVLVDMAKAGTAQLGFKWKDVTSGSPSVRIWSGSPNIDKPDYLKSRNTAIQTLNQNDPLACDSDRLVSGTKSVWLRGSLMNDATGAVVNLLMEGVSVGVGKLTFMIKVGTQESEGPAIDLKLLNVRQMYERGKITVDAPDIPNPWSNPNPPALTWVWDPWNWQPDIDPNADQKTIAYVHGWRMTYNESLQWADTSFKRLWQIGYKGRFYAFRWPTYHGENNGPNPADLYKPGGTTYNPSEYRAWLSGAALANFVNGLPNGNTRYLIAHSMGNVVCGSALRNNMQVTRYAMCNSAMAAMAYDGTLKPDDPIYQTPDTDTDAGIRQTFGLANKFNPAGTEIINFSLPDDAALGQWTLNNRLFKPQLFADLTSYNYNPTLIVARRLEYENWVSHRAVTSVSEAMAYVTQSRTRAAGARQDTGGSVVSFVHLGDDAGGFGFGTEHSAEWVYSIQKTYPFWKEVLKKFDVDVTNR